jgi:hypothetical protein
MWQTLASSAGLAEGQIVVLSRLRFVVGVCVLAAGLLMGAGGAVAVADPGSNNSAAHGANASGQQHSTGAKKAKDAKNSKDEPGNTASKDGSLGSGGPSVQQPSSGAKKPKVEPVGTDTTDGTKDDSDLGAGVAHPVAAVPNDVAPVSEVAVAPVPDVIGPVSNVSALVQDMLTSVAGAVVPLTQLQSDLYSFLLSIAGVPPVVSGVGGIHGPGVSAAAGASVASRLPLGRPRAGISDPPRAGVSGLPVTGEATGVAPLDVIALGRASAVSGMTPVAADAAFPLGAGSSFRHVFDEPLLIASLWALAAGVLPGIGGLVIVTVVGVRVQYGRLMPDSHREHRVLRDSPIPRAVKRWMSAR